MGTFQRVNVEESDVCSILRGVIDVRAWLSPVPYNCILYTLCFHWCADVQLVDTDVRANSRVNKNCTL